jgi:dolichol-phosphate mannosyltransferase
MLTSAPSVSSWDDSVALAFEVPVSRCVVVIPTYNESENLPLLVPQVLAKDPRIEILVVDDDSPDGTGDIAEVLAKEDPRVHVLHRPRKEGLGPAYRAGFARALELGADWVAQMDADFSHPPDALPDLLAPMEDHDAVMGSRYLNGITVVNWPIERILLSYFGNLYVRKVTGLPISDTTGGFRCMRREILERIGVERIPTTEPASPRSPSSFWTEPAAPPSSPSASASRPCGWPGGCGSRPSWEESSRP